MRSIVFLFGACTTGRYLPHAGLAASAGTASLLDGASRGAMILLRFHGGKRPSLRNAFPSFLER
jgi:hypothetical protein